MSVSHPNSRKKVRVLGRGKGLELRKEIEKGLVSSNELYTNIIERRRKVCALMEVVIYNQTVILLQSFCDM